MSTELRLNFSTLFSNTGKNFLPPDQPPRFSTYYYGEDNIYQLMILSVKREEYSTTSPYPLNQIFSCPISREFYRFQSFIDSILELPDPCAPFLGSFTVDSHSLRNIDEYEEIFPLIIGNCLKLRLIVELRNWENGYDPYKSYLFTKISMASESIIY